VSLVWHYPDPDRPSVRFDEIRPVAELYDERSGMRKAIVVRSDNWPESTYRILAVNRTNRFVASEAVESDCNFLEAQAIAYAMASLT
jgi:hypothetical protein